MATDLERLTVQIEAQTAKFDKALSRIEGRTVSSTRKVEKQFSQMQKRIDGSFSAIGSQFKGALAAAGLGLGAQQLLQYADGWTKANNALKVAGLSGDNLTSVLDQLYAAAQRQGAPIEALTTLYGRLAQSQKELGATQGELVQFSEDVATALRVAGTSPEEATGALLQLSQALGSARVQAEKFNSINEGARPILQAVANGIEEAGGSVSKLKALVTDGKISNVAFFKGFQAGVQTIRDQADSAEPTISSAFTRVQNAIMRLVGEIDKAGGFSKSFISEMEEMADKMKALVEPIMFVVDALKMLNDLQNYINANGLNLGTKFNQAIFGTDTLEEFISPEESKGVGPSTRNTARSQVPPPIKAANYPVIGGKEKKGSTRADDYAREIKQIRERTAALELEAEMVGKSTFEVERARAAQDLLNAAKEAGKAITPELVAQIDAEAEAHARAVVKLEQAQEAYRRFEEVRDGLAGSFSGMFSSLRQGEDAIQSLTDSLGRLADRLMDMIADQLFKQLFAGIPGLNFSGLGAATTGTGGIGHAATGGSIRGPGSGTSDSIPTMLSNGEFVVRASQAKRYGALLEAINSGRLRVPGFATGGSVGGPVARSGGGTAGAPKVTVNNYAAGDGYEARTQSGGIDGERLVVSIVRKATARGELDQAQRMRFGSGPRKNIRG
ncbi:tape measure protein [Xanthobacter autotrophicus]|uniref:tape measure protein n=1 Tax=Xanthobacter autotrophicus TaxID=280 RepID=UPI00372AB2BE